MKIPNGNGKKIIYIIGKYRDDTEEKKRDNIWHAVRVACRLWELNWIVFCPHLNTANFENFTKLADRVWLNGGLEILRRCDAVFVLSNFGDSDGSHEELELAKALGLEIFYEST